MDNSPEVPPGHSFVGYTPDGHVITATGGVVYDDDYIAAEEAHHQAQRDAVIEQYGSLEAYDEWVLEQTRRLRITRRRDIRRHRVERAQIARRIVAAGAVSTRQGRREARPAQRRRTSSSSTTSSSDPGDPEPDGEPSNGGLRPIR